MFKEYIKKQESEGKEKHVPFIGTSECTTCGEIAIIIKVGKEVFHPSTPEHYIDYIDLFGIMPDGKLVPVTKFTLGKENTVPYVKTHIKKGLFKKLLALSFCNIHGMWENEIELQ